jgi:hypothetical protein
LIENEYKKVKEVATKIGLDDWILNCKSTYEKNLPPECVIIDKDHFSNFYGKIYSSRAQFAAGRLYIFKKFVIFFLLTKKFTLLQPMIKFVLIWQNFGNYEL